MENCSASSGVLSLMANFSSAASPSEKSCTNQTNAFSALGIGLSSHCGASDTTKKDNRDEQLCSKSLGYLLMKLATGLRVFSWRMTKRICFSARSRISLAFPMPRSFHYSSRQRKSFALIFMMHSRFSSPLFVACVGMST